MPSVSEHVSIDFSWSDLIDRSLNASDFSAIALAAVKAGIAPALIEALRLAINTPSMVTAAEPRNLDSDFDHLITDYARGLPIERQLKTLAARHLNRIIISTGRFQ